MNDPYTHSSPRVRYKPLSHLHGENQASLCSALYSWSHNLAKHQEAVGRFGIIVSWTGWSLLLTARFCHSPRPRVAPIPLRTVPRPVASFFRKTVDLPQTKDGTWQILDVGPTRLNSTFGHQPTTICQEMMKNKVKNSRQTVCRVHDTRHYILHSAN
jgi:hypothetical protein